jgi:ABC-type transport system involved in cytochrome c biogenesis permease component
MKLLTKPTLITATIIYLILLLPSVLLIPFSIILLSNDSESFITTAFSLLSALFPMILIASILGSWMANVYNKNKTLITFLLLPILHSILLVVFGLFYFAK